MKIRKKLKLVSIIVPVLLSLFLIISAIVIAQQAAQAIVALLSAQRPGDMTTYKKQKLQVAPEIANLRQKFKTAIKAAIKQYNSTHEYKISKLEEDDKALLCWMVGVCAAYTQNWTVNTEHNIMGVYGLPADCTPEQSIVASARLIVSLYGELAEGDPNDTLVEGIQFMTDYYLSKEAYYDPEVYCPYFCYHFNSDFYFGYESADGKTYKEMNPGADQKDIEIDQMASQKMMMFTACYFYGTTDIRKFWSFKYAGPSPETSDMSYADGGWSDEKNGVFYKFWDYNILNEYDRAYINKQQRALDAERQAAMAGSPMEMNEFEQYAESVVFRLDLSLIDRVYEYYDIYNVQINTGQKIGLPVDEQYAGQVDYSTLTDFMGYRDAFIVGYDEDGNPKYSSGKRYDEDKNPIPTSPHCGIDIWIPEGENLIACISGTVTETKKRTVDGDGCVIGITSYDGAYTFRYLHCQEGSILKDKGDSVFMGEVIAFCGKTGGVTGEHLHFEIIDNSDGKRIDPLFILTNGAQRCDYGEDDFYKLEGTACKIIYEVPEWFLPKSRYEECSEENIYLFLREYGFNTAVSCGIMSCLWGESHFDTGAIEELEGGKSGPGFGLAQWSYGRRVNLLNWLEENGFEANSFEGQMWFLMHELETTESYAYSMIKDIPDTSAGAYQAGFNFALYFERPTRGEVAADEAGDRARDDFYPKYQFYDESDASASDEPTTTQTAELTPEMFADSLFIGDSRVNRLFNEDMLSKAARFAKDGIGNTGLVSASLYVDGVGTVTLEELLQSQSYKRIYIANGINQMWAGAKGNFEAFEELYGIVRKYAPDADIYIQSVIPTSYVRMLEYPEYFDKSIINDYNQRLKDLCDENSKTYFIDIASIYVDSTGYFNPVYTSDGLHQDYDCQYLWIEELAKRTRSEKSEKKNR